MERAIEIAKQLAGLPADKDVRRVVFPEPKPFFETFFDDENSADLRQQEALAAFASSLPEDVRLAFRYTEIFERMKLGDAMTMLPFELNIR
jgi:hypothetical protein